MRLNQLNDDCLVAILSQLTGPPPTQAIDLAHVGQTCQRMRPISLEAGHVLVQAHMQAARQELAQVAQLQGTPRQTVPSLALDAPLAAKRCPLRTLWCQIPVLPLAWTVMQNSLIDSSSGIVEKLAAVGIQTRPWKGGMRISWSADSMAETARALPLATGAAPAYSLACDLGLAGHPGLVTRWRVASRRAAPCPCCHRWRRLDAATHRTWEPDALDKETLSLPAKLDSDEAQRIAELKSRRSGRDAEEFEIDEVSVLPAGPRLVSTLTRHSMPSPRRHLTRLACPLSPWPGST